MSSTKTDTFKVILSWGIGILVCLFSDEAGTQVLHNHGISNRFLDVPIFGLSAMVGARIGMAIHAGQLNGGVSRKGNIQFMRWVASIIIIFSIGIFSQTLLDIIFDGYSDIKNIIVSFLMMGVGFILCVKWRLLYSPTF